MHATRNRRHAQVSGAGMAQAADLTDAERHELIVRRYLLARLREAEEGQRKRDAAVKAKATATYLYAKAHDRKTQRRRVVVQDEASAAASAYSPPQAVIEALSTLDEDGAPVPKNASRRSIMAGASSRFMSAAMESHGPRPRTAK